MTRGEIIAANPLEQFLSGRGYELRPAGANRVTNACPVSRHKRYHRPVTIHTGKNLWHCNDCDCGGSIIDWVMIEQNVTAADAIRILGGGGNGFAKLTETYDYTDEAGNLLFQTCRYQPKDFKQRRPDGQGGWIWNLEGVRRVLYQLPKVVASPIVTVSEGEKDCDQLIKLGFVATTNPLGAEKWRTEHSEVLRGKDVVIFGDNDARGRAHVQQVIASLSGIAKSIKRVTIPLSIHDVSEYIESCPLGAAAESIAKLIDQTPALELPTPQLAKPEDGGTRGNSSCAERPSWKSAATRLVELSNEFTFFHDPQDRPFVRLEINGHLEVWPVESSKFRKLLARTYYKQFAKAAHRNAITDAITILAARACHDGPEERVSVRVAAHSENRLCIDLCDVHWRVVEVTPIGWQVLERSPVAFLRTGGAQQLPSPARAARGSLEPLWALLNVTRDHRRLVAGALLNFFHPSGPYFVLDLVGEQGTGKSCAARIMRQCVDPSANPLRSPPRDERDLIAQAASNWCVALDNLSFLPPWLSDGLCRLATGGGHSARELYTDLDEISLAVKRPVILNGIGDVAGRPDLAERALQIELETIEESRRIPESELWRSFEAAGPVIFAALLNGLVCALRERSNVKLDALPRMADAALWATAGETAFGWERGRFMAAYRQNLNQCAIASVESHPVGVVIGQLLEAQNEWEGQPSELLKALNTIAADEQRDSKSWPTDARSLGHSLRRLAPALRRAGIGYERTKGTRRIIRLCKVGKKTSASTETSESSPSEVDQDVFGDVLQQLHDSNAALVL